MSLKEKKQTGDVGTKARLLLMGYKRFQNKDNLDSLLRLWNDKRKQKNITDCFLPTLYCLEVYHPMIVTE